MYERLTSESESRADVQSQIAIVGLKKLCQIAATLLHSGSLCVTVKEKSEADSMWDRLSIDFRANELETMRKEALRNELSCEVGLGWWRTRQTSNELCALSVIIQQTYSVYIVEFIGACEFFCCSETSLCAKRQLTFMFPFNFNFLSFVSHFFSARIILRLATDQTTKQKGMRNIYSCEVVKII